MMRVALTTLGCKANWSDAEAMAQELAAHGCEIVSVDHEADAYVINTCTVTALANQQSRQCIRRLRRRNRRATILVTGCYAQVADKELRAMAEVDAIFGTQDRKALIAFLLEHAVTCSQEGRSDGMTLIPKGAQSRARAFLKVQDGCQRHCSYCIVPQARGKVRSMPFEEIAEACRMLSQHHAEIVLSGIDIAQYGTEWGQGPALSEMLSDLVTLPQRAQIRISSLHPQAIDERLIELLQAGKLCRHIHLSLQNGSDRILRLMRRGYAREDLLAIAQQLHEAVEDIAITGDLIVGFPSEREEDHRATLELLEQMPLAGLHVFPFSARPGTPAAEMDGQVPKDEKRKRAAQVRRLARKKREAYLQGLCGKRVDAIVVSRETNAAGMVEAMSEQGFRMQVSGDAVAYGGLGRAVITEVKGLEVRGLWEHDLRRKSVSKALKSGCSIASSTRSI